MDMLKLIQEAAEAARKTVIDGLGRAKELTGTENQFGDKTLILDRQAEESIVEVLLSASIPIKIMSEEMGILEPDKQPEYLAVIDPIDGSANLERGIPLCSVGIALVPYGKHLCMNDIELSIVKSFFTDETYIAETGKGATRNGTTIHVRETQSTESAIISYDTKKQWSQDFARASTCVLSKIKDMRRTASNLLDLCWVANGSLDAMVDMRGILPIVHIMGTHIVKEAGGYIIGLNGKQLNVPIDTEYRMSFIAAASKDLARDLLTCFRS